MLGDIQLPIESLSGRVYKSVKIPVRKLVHHLFKMPPRTPPPHRRFRVPAPGNNPPHPRPNGYPPLVVTLTFVIVFSYVVVMVASPSPFRQCPSTDEMNRCFTRLPKNSKFVKEVCKGLEAAKTSNPTALELSNKTSKSTATVETTGKPKQILLWTTFFRWDDFRFGLGREPFMAAGCRYTNCLTTTDKSLANQSDALIFHPNDFDVDNLPRHRLAAQRYVFLYYEAMASERERLSVFTEPLKNYFNWTMTHRRDSDVFSSHPYGRLRRKSTSIVANVLPQPLPEGETPPDPSKMFDTLLHPKVLGNKTKLAAWFNSNCETLGGREKYFREMGQYTQIDTYGACGHLKCDPAEGTHCDKLLDNYKFYIAAENSLCADYVTEKFYRALEADVVPIVYGGADYSAYAPANSYINTADFASPKALAEYLYVLDTNPGLYSKYFDWKKDWEVIRFPTDGWCDLCEKLNRPEEPAKSYEDIGTWFYDKVPCLPGSSLKNLYGEK